jgi:hypothetical protein
MNKLLSRFRFLSVKYGDLLETLFKTSAKKHDPQSSESDLYNLQHTDGYIGKFSDEKSRLTIFDKNIPNISIYCVLWILKIISFFVLWKAKKT